MFKHSQLLVLSVAAFLLMLGDGMVLALLPQTVITLANSSSLVGYLASTYAFAQVASQLPIGVFADRWGFKFFVLMGYILSVIAGLLFYSTNSVNLIFCGRILQGIGEAPILSLAPAVLSLRYPENKGKAIGVYNASIYLGMTIGPFLRVVLFKTWSDNQIFLFYAILCVAGAIIIACSMKNKLKNQNVVTETITIKSLLALTRNPQILAVLSGIALYGAGFGIFMTIIPAFLILVKGYSQSYINIFFSLFYIAISMAQIVIGCLSDRLGRQVFMIVGMLAAAGGLAISLYFDHFALTAALCFSSFGLGTYYLASMAFLNEKVSDGNKGAITGIYYLFWGIGMFWGPLILNSYIEENSYSLGFYIFSEMLVIQAIVLFASKFYPFQATKEVL
ncbi:MFS transporter [Pelosinus fermentans]|uniref:Major facilitator superfamily MFS_1 n=1 Tax=Pelosinus fermentans B4 TaxID=1149862 RepID=I9B0Q9_9FIRM|nr:MFS transporter [Pelosinus fermentans]EIW18737.1 major facilitator superfamily MFS_1 [Pelosinus fermentans B4]EIW22053.1 major facilitator superfamily MFS_1 [Pelosinus fermentans A11]OAM95094.1 major facilitator superfamily MFS_1 [Pelosinus fermentans DSM 17108]SDR23224.1 Predicted arabinose efflux permease, MFS family [Pelosinus fermentans]